MITVDMIMSWDPCEEYPRERIEQLFSGSVGLTPQDVAALDISVEDRIWCLLHEEVIPAAALHGLACEFASRALARERAAGREPDPRSWAAIEVKRAWIRGEATDEQLASARAAAWAAYRDAAWTAAWTASRAAAWAAARDAALAAAGAAALDADDAAGAAAWDAAWAAARDSANAAAGAAGDAERALQLARIMEVIG